MMFRVSCVSFKAGGLGNYKHVRAAIQAIFMPQSSVGHWDHLVPPRLMKNPSVLQCKPNYKPSKSWQVVTLRSQTIHNISNPSFQGPL